MADVGGLSGCLGSEHSRAPGDSDCFALHLRQLSVHRRADHGLQQHLLSRDTITGTSRDSRIQDIDPDPAAAGA